MPLPTEYTAYGDGDRLSDVVVMRNDDGTLSICGVAYGYVKEEIILSVRQSEQVRAFLLAAEDHHAA